MKFCLFATRLIGTPVVLAVLLCAVRARAQVSANPSADGALADIGSPNLSATPDASQAGSSGSGNGRSLLRQQTAAGGKATSSRALTSTSRISQQRQATPYTATGLGGTGTSTNSAPRPLYGGTSTPPVTSIGFKSGVGRSLGTGLSSGFSTGTLLGSSPAGGLRSSPGSSVSQPGSSGRVSSTGSSASSRGNPAHGTRGRSRLDGLAQKYTFQPPRSRYDKAAPESSFRGRHLSDQQ